MKRKFLNMISELTKKFNALHFEFWSAYQLLYYLDSNNNDVYRQIFNTSYWGGMRPTFKEVESFANSYWKYKNIIRITKTNQDIKFIIDELEHIGSLYPLFLDTLYLCTSDLFRKKYSSLQEAIQEIIDLFNDEEELDNTQNV